MGQTRTFNKDAQILLIGVINRYLNAHTLWKYSSTRILVQGINYSTKNTLNVMSMSMYKKKVRGFQRDDTFKAVDEAYGWFGNNRAACKFPIFLLISKSLFVT